MIRIIIVEISTLINERTDQKTITTTKNEYWLKAIDFLKSQFQFFIHENSDRLFKALRFFWYHSTDNSLFCSPSQCLRRSQIEYCTTTRRSKHLCKSWSTFWKLWDFILISHFSLFCSTSSNWVQFSNSTYFYPANHFCKSSNQLKMTSASVFLINRRDYDESSSSSSSSPFALSQKKNYSEHVNEYITLLIKKWKSLNLQDTNLWITFRDDFEKWTKQNFKTATNDVLRSLRNFLRKQNVWISRQERKTIARSLQEVIEKETKTSWTEKKIMNSLNEKFESSKITRLIKTDFERNSRDYSWQASSRSKSRKASSRQSLWESSESRELSLRDRSVKERAFQQALMRQLLRESFIARNFLRQSSSSSSQSKVQEIFSSEISEISENSYSDSLSHQLENLYIRQSLSEKKSIFRYSFQSSRFSKFYQSSQLSKQFYKRFTNSSFVSQTIHHSFRLDFYHTNILHRSRLDHLHLDCLFLDLHFHQ